MGRTPSGPLLLLALLLVGVLGGCIEDEGADPPAWPGDPDVVTEPVDLGAGFTVGLPEQWAVEQAFTAPSAGVEEECSSIPASLSAPGVYVAMGLPAAACAGEEPEEPLNGEHGDYTSVDDAFDPRSVETAEVALGELTTFVQTYTECTNECVEVEERVALVALADPVSDDRSTLMVVVPVEDASLAQLTALVESIEQA